MAALNCLVPLLSLLIPLAQLITAAPQAEDIVQLKARYTIPSSPVITIGGYHHLPVIDINEGSLTTPRPSVIQTIARGLVNSRQLSGSDNDVSFTVPPPPIIQHGGLHFEPTPAAPSLTDTFTPLPAPLISTMWDRPSVTIAGMSQVITSQVPVLTICPLPLPGLFVPSASESSTAAHNLTSPPVPSSGPRFGKRQPLASKPVPVPPIKTAPFPSLSRPNISCSIFYTPTTTPICRTTLSPLAAPVIPITACDQSVTFSSEYGYRIVPSSSSVETLTSYFVAPWQDLYPGAVPTGDVLAVVCSSGHVGCTTESEFWEGTIIETYSTGVTTMAFEATVTGPANVIVMDLTTIAVGSTTTTVVTLSTIAEITQMGTGLGIHRGATMATERSRDGIPTMTTVLQATTRTVTLPGTSGAENLDG